MVPSCLRTRAASRQDSAEPRAIVPAVRLTGIRALVTGASRGVGRAVAEAYAAEGAEVAVTATDLMHLDALVTRSADRGETVHPFALDLADRAAPGRVGAAVLARMGGLDVLVNNAGLLGVKAPLAESPPDVFEEVLDVSVVGPLRLLQAVLPGMTDGGAIINVTSGAAGRQGWGAYGVSQDTVNGLGQFDSVLAPTDLFAVFYRRRFTGGGRGRVWAGLSGNGDVIFGLDGTVPLGTNWALDNNFTCLFPKHGRSAGGPPEESWSVSIHLVWYPGRAAGPNLTSPFYPLFYVADNSWFLIDRR